ncbi:NADH-quinone oxidoreductase subunit N [Dyadobacter tibetensis]|uniref:NADH-quinone oxidoreductase subunit N n=1 Tax=Dyadobacter tibetensis TaxID=1211851 RepID=UPI00046FC30C|nr:NADH-quinone oxidoreductase subunit N [Dyadobacter tibetensis]
MSPSDYICLLPLIILALASVIVMLVIVAKGSHKTIQFVSLALFALAFASLFPEAVPLPHAVPPLLLMDRFGAFVIALILLSGGVVCLLSYLYFEGKEEGPKEYYLLLFLCSLGGGILAISQHFISFFLGLEILTIALYALIAYLKSRPKAIEAGIKYLVLAAFSSAFLLMGMALIYMEVGNMSFAGMSGAIRDAPSLPPLFLAGLTMLLVGVGFKLAVVPFHMWAADVYQGAPIPVTALIATVSKAGVLAVLIRLFLALEVLSFPRAALGIGLLAVASILVGNILALQQKNIKRLLAYSSIAHLGYMLVGFVPGTRQSFESLSFYLVSYILATLTAFGIIACRSSKSEESELLKDYQGLFWSHPKEALILTISMLSLAGIPLTAGFTGKFYLLLATLEPDYWALAFVLVLGSAVGLYYYLRVITTLFGSYPIQENTPSLPVTSFYILCLSLIGMLAILTIVLGIFPSPLIEYIRGIWIS